MRGIVLVHGDHKIFLREQSIKDFCAMVCPVCRKLIMLNKDEMLKYIEDWKPEEIKREINE